MPDFVARLHREGVDPPMLLFGLRRLGVQATMPTPTQGADDMELRGTVEDVDGLVKALSAARGAIHIGDRHVELAQGKVVEHDDAAAAEHALGGPFTTPGFPRTAWAFGGPPMDHIVQVLFFAEEHLPLPKLAKAVGIPLETAAAALKRLAANQTVRKFRQDGEAWSDAYGLANAVRQRVEGLRSA